MPEEGCAFVEALPVAKFHGVGPATAARMHAAGIQTGADLKTWSLQDLQHRFGKAGTWYYAIARGQDDRAVNPNRERKSSGSETTFEEDLTDPVRIEAGVLAVLPASKGIRLVGVALSNFTGDRPAIGDLVESMGQGGSTRPSSTSR